MPYVSPRGLVKATAPPRRKSTAAMFKAPESAEYKELGDPFQRQASDPEAAAMMDKMDHWTGWTAIMPHRHHLNGLRVFDDEDEDEVEDEDGNISPLQERHQMLEPGDIVGTSASQGDAIPASIGESDEGTQRATKKESTDRSIEIEDVHQEPVNPENVSKRTTPEDSTPSTQ